MQDLNQLSQPVKLAGWRVQLDIKTKRVSCQSESLRITTEVFSKTVIKATRRWPFSATGSPIWMQFSPSNILRYVIFTVEEVLEIRLRLWAVGAAWRWCRFKGIMTHFLTRTPCAGEPPQFCGKCSNRCRFDVDQQKQHLPIQRLRSRRLLADRK